MIQVSTRSGSTYLLDGLHIKGKGVEGRTFDNKWLTLAEAPEVVPGFCMFLRFVDPVDGPSRVLQTTHVVEVREVQVA